MSDSLRSLRTNEQLWANHSGRSFQKSDCEQIAQVSYDKWATISNSLRSLMINEQIACLFWLNRSFTLALTKNEPLAQKKLTKIIFFVTFFEHLKQKQVICSFPLFYWVMWVNRSGRSPKMSKSLVFLSELLICSFFAKYEQFAQKTDEQIPNPAQRSGILLGKVRINSYQNTQRSGIWLG